MQFSFKCGIITLGDYMTIGEKIKQIRESKKMTQEQVGNLCGMTKQRIHQVEICTTYPRLSTIISISKAMDCPLRDILNEPLQLGFTESTKKDTDYPCKNASKCMFFKKKE